MVAGHPPNLSIVSDDRTARTDPEVAFQRAYNLAVLGAKTVMELCAGPSAEVLDEAYFQNGIYPYMNDIDPRWKRYWPNSQWEIGDALQIDWQPYDALVFAPPLSYGCTGRRTDALRIEEVFPRYVDFLQRPYHGIRVLVLPARAIATGRDRQELYSLIGGLSKAEVVPMTAGRRNIRKYVDVYITP